MPTLFILTKNELHQSVHAFTSRTKENSRDCSGNPVSGNAIVRYDLEDGNFYTPYVFSGDEDFVKTLDLTLLEGAPITSGTQGKLVNETFVRQFAISNPVGEKIPGTNDKILGVVKILRVFPLKSKFRRLSFPIPKLQTGY